MHEKQYAVDLYVGLTEEAYIFQLQPCLRFGARS